MGLSWTFNPDGLAASPFFIDNAKIHLVYSAMFDPPPDQPVPNWPPYEGNFPLPAGVGSPAAATPAK